MQPKQPCRFRRDGFTGIYHAENFGRISDMSANADPVTAYRTCLRDVRGGIVGDMGFSLADFKTFIAGLEKPDWTKPSQP
jgi:hypothetical protein